MIASASSVSADASASSGLQVHDGAVAEREREDVESARIATEPHRPRREGVPQLVVPQVASDEPRQPEPPHDVVRVARRVLHERVEGSPQWRQAADIAIREPRHQAVQEEVGRSWRSRWGRSAARGLGRLPHADAATETPGEDRGSERLEIRLAGGAAVDGLESLRCIEQQRRGVVAARPREHDLGAEARGPGGEVLVQRARLRSRQELVSRVGCPGFEVRACGGQRSPAPLGRIGRQLRRVRQERRSSRRASSCLCAVGRALELGGDRLVDTHRGTSAMPRPTIGIGVRIGRLRQRAMRSSPLRRRRRPVHRRSHQRMPEADTGSDLDEPRVLRRSERGRLEAEPVSRTPEQRRVADRLGGRQQQ